MPSVNSHRPVQASQKISVGSDVLRVLRLSKFYNPKSVHFYGFCLLTHFIRSTQHVKHYHFRNIHNSVKYKLHYIIYCFYQISTNLKLRNSLIFTVSFKISEKKCIERKNSQSKTLLLNEILCLGLFDLHRMSFEQ